jgi:hypothetical protein
MKNNIRLIGIIALFAIIGFSFASCGDAGSNGGNVTNEKAVYTSKDGEGNVYELTITKNSNKAVYDPKLGDLFKLVITFVNGTKKTSEGTVAEAKSGSTTMLTLSVSGSLFAVSISKVTEEVSVMTEITGTIPITSSDDNDTSPVIIEEVTLAPQVDNGNKAVIGVILNKTEIDLDVGDTEALLATVLPSNAANKSVTWSSSNTSIATVSSNGTVTTVSEGGAIITVTTADGRKTATCNVTVSTTLTPDTLETYLATLPENTVNTAYNISLKVNSDEEFVAMSRALGFASNKYVKLDLTGSTITSFYRNFVRFNNLVSIIIPDSVTNSFNFDFYECTNLVSVTIGNGLTSIRDDAFFNCTSLTSIIIPNNVTSIGGSAFYGCTSLASVTIGSGVTSIESEAFRHCRSLASITIPNNVTSIGGSAFYGCTSLVSVTFKGTISSSKFGSGSFTNDLRRVFYLTDSANGTPGTYTTANPGPNSTWTKQP